MPTDAERLAHITPKIKRAKMHCAELERAIQIFMTTKPYKVGFTHEAESRKLVYFVSSVEPPPESLPLIAGDAIQNLMGALDHLAYQLVCRDTGGKPPKPSAVYFPIANDLSDYNANKARKLQGAAQRTINAIDGLKPYKGGDDMLWTLHRLNNIDKHRLLLTVGSHAAGFNIAQYMAHTLGEGFSESARRALSAMSFFVNPEDAGFPLKEGYKILIGRIDEIPNLQQQFRFDVALSEPGVIESSSLLETLAKLIGAVESAIEKLTPLLGQTR